MVSIEPIINEPALMIEEAMVIADLHIGIEKELQEKGLQAPSQTEPMIKRLVSLIKRYKPKDIILLGDIKHNIPSIKERTDVKRFLEALTPYSTIHILPGNHDGNIHKILTKETLLHSSSGYVFKEVGLVHGHRWPCSEVMQCKYVVIAHTHPTVMLTDRLGYKSFEQCWLRGNFLHVKRRFIVMPAFNPLCGGIAANKEPIIGPFGKIVDLENAEVYLLNGTALGRIKDLK